MIDPRFVVLGAVITVAGSASYARDTLRGRTQPNRVSWALWTVAPLIAFAAEVSQEIGLQALLTLAVGVGPLLVLVASLANRHAYVRLSPFDLACGALSIAALVAWLITGTGDLAILFSILADFFGAVPTVRKAYRWPRSESAGTFLASACGATITLLTIERWSFASAAFASYIVVAGTSSLH